MSAGGGLRHDGDEDNFVIVPRPTVRDPELSLRALGLLTYLLDLPTGWDVNAKRLEREVKEGREAIYSALRELRAAGYYRIEKRQVAGGRWATGTAVAKLSRPAWKAEYAEQEAARLAKVAEPIPEWIPPAEEPESDDSDTLTEVREPVPRSEVREPGDRSPVDREAGPLKEDPPRRREDGGEGVQLSTELTFPGPDVATDHKLSPSVVDGATSSAPWGTTRPVSGPGSPEWEALRKRLRGDPPEKEVAVDDAPEVHAGAK